MSKRTIYTCDICGKDVEPVEPVSFEFGIRAVDWSRLAPYLQPVTKARERLWGDACSKCARRVIEELQARFLLKYEVHE